MKTSLTILTLIALQMPWARSAVVSVDVGVSAFSYEIKQFDIDHDGITDFTFRGDGGTCTADFPTSVCSFSVTLQGRQGVEFLFDPSLGGQARPLVAGDIVGFGTSPGFWGAAAYSSLNVSAAMLLLDPANSGYPDFLDGFAVYSIGFRQNSGVSDYLYGWIDVALYVPVIGGPESMPDAIATPLVVGIHHADTPGEEVAFTPIPEPTSIGLLVVTWVWVLKRNRRTGRSTPNTYPTANREPSGD